MDLWITCFLRFPVLLDPALDFRVFKTTVFMLWTYGSPCFLRFPVLLDLA